MDFSSLWHSWLRFRKPKKSSPIRPGRTRPHLLLEALERRELLNSTFTSSGPIDLGQTATVSFTGGGLAYSYDFDNNGTFEIAYSRSAQATVPASYLNTVGPHVVHGRVMVSSNSFVDYTTTITVNPLPTATFANSGPVDLGQTATVSLTNSGGGSGAYIYSYDFDNNGTFESANIASTQATVPASYLGATGSHLIHGRITDSSGGFTDYTTTITVNPLPTATFANGSPVDVGQTATVSFTAPGGGSGAYTYSYDFDNNGTFESANIASTQATVLASYLGTTGSHLIHGRITDSSGGFTDYTTTITVNPLPTATFANSGPVDLGQTATISLTNSGGGSGAYTYSYDFDNNGTFESANIASTQATVPASYLGATGSHLIHGRITDSSGGFTDYTTTITVNPLPTATFANGGPVDLGQTATISFTASGGGSGAYTYSYDFDNNGTFEIANSVSTLATVPASYLRATGSHLIHGRITDSSGGFTDYTTAITVNPLPIATLANSGPVDLGQTATVSFTSPGGGSGGYTYSYDFDNNGSFEIAATSSTQATVPASFLNTVGAHSIHGRITDSNGGFTDYTTAITVNPLPSATFANGGPVDMGQTATVAFTATAGGSGAYTYSYDFDNNGTFDNPNSASALATVPASFLNTVGSHLIHGRITDSSGGFTDYTTSIIVNPLPSATLANSGPVDMGQTATVAFTATAGGSGAYTYSYDFDNNGTFDNPNSASALATVPASFLNTVGIHLIHGRITDSSGGFTDYTTTIAVTPLPTATFANGGPVDLGQTATVAFTAPGGGSGAYIYSYDFGNNGTFEIANSASALATVPASYLGTTGSHLIHGRITDSGGGFTDYTTTITVNPLPTATFTNGGPVDLGQTTTVSFTAPGGGSGGYLYSYDFDNNGTFEINGSSSAQVTVPASYLNAVGTQIIHGRIVDSSDGFTDYTTTITVNPLPTATFTNSGPVDPGQTANVSFTAPNGGSGSYIYSYDFDNDGTFGMAGNNSAQVTVPASYLSTTGSHLIYGRITDSSGGFTDYTTTITVNPLPTATFTNSGPVDLGQTANVSFTSSAGGSGGYSYSYDFDNNGTFEINGSGSAQVTVPASYLSTTGSHLIHGRITDSSGDFTDYTTTITVNPLPTATFSNSGPVNPGQTATVAFTAAGGGSGVYTYSYDFANSGTFNISSSAQATVPASYLSTPGAHLIHGRIIDSSGGFTDYTTTITVNAQSTATLTNSGPVDLGQTATVAFTCGGLAFSYDFDNNGTFEINYSRSAQATVPASYLSTPGAHVIHGRVLNSSSGYSDYTTTITVNPLPTATLTNSGPVGLGQTATVAFTAPSDGSAGYTYSYDVDNDGGFEIANSGSAQATVPGSYLGVPGNHVVHGRIFDSNGGYSDYTTTITVNPTTGHTYYVSPTGNDSNTGSADSPWLTIQNAVNIVQPGDTVIVRGSYAGFLMSWNAPQAGTAKHPITFEADPAATPGSVIINARVGNTHSGIDLEPGSDYVTISGFTIMGGGNIAAFPDKGSGIKVCGNYDSVINNTIANIDYGFGILADNANNVVLKNNTITGTGSHGIDNYGHGIYLSGSLDGAVVQGNVIHDNDLIGIHINGDVSEGGVGLVTHALIEDNLIYNNGQNGINADGLQSSLIENNLIYGYQKYGIVLYQIDAGDGSENNVIVNNTIVSTVAGAGAAVRILDGGTGNTILNNILLGGGGVAVQISDDSLPGLVSNYNIGGGLFQSEDSGLTETPDQWRAQTGQDANSRTATSGQLFVNATANNYHLAASSPAVNAGTNTDAPATDIVGIARPSGQIDIGAYQG